MPETFTMYMTCFSGEPTQTGTMYRISVGLFVKTTRKFMTQSRFFKKMSQNFPQLNERFKKKRKEQILTISWKEVTNL